MMNICSSTLFPEQSRSFQEWKNIFANSSSAHFANKQTSKFAHVDDPQYSAYALLGPRYCPVAYYSDRNF